MMICLGGGRYPHLFKTKQKMFSKEPSFVKLMILETSTVPSKKIQGCNYIVPPGLKMTQLPSSGLVEGQKPSFMAGFRLFPSKKPSRFGSSTGPCN